MSRVSLRWLLGLATAFLGLWLVKYLSESEMRRLDKEVDRLCAIDGGMRIFETVRLSPNKFSQYGPPLVPEGRDDTGYGYFMRYEGKNLDGPRQAPGARLVRNQAQVVRTEDGKVMAESVIYTRGGGYWLEGVPGIGHGKNCPDPGSLDVRARVLLKE
jgi:hypothetical protein